jgi:hypothetical protein
MLAGSVRHPENLVAYQTPSAERNVAASRLEALSAITAGQSDMVARDIEARRQLPDWHVRIERADIDVAAQRYEDALAGYEKVPTQILALIVPNMTTGPSTWPEGITVTQAIDGASATRARRRPHQARVTGFRTSDAIAATPQLNPESLIRHPVVSRNVDTKPVSRRSVPARSLST